MTVATTPMMMLFANASQTAPPSTLQTFSHLSKVNPRHEMFDLIESLNENTNVYDDRDQQEDEREDRVRRQEPVAEADPTRRGTAARPARLRLLALGEPAEHGGCLDFAAHSRSSVPDRFT